MLVDVRLKVTRVQSLFFFSSRRRHTRLQGDWSSDVCSSDWCVPRVAAPPHKLRRASAWRTYDVWGKRAAWPEPCDGARGMKLLPLDNPELIELVAGWIGQEENYKWLDFGNGILAPTAVSLKVMTQRDLHVLRVFTPDESDLPIGVVGLSNVDRRFKTASSLWAVLGRKRYGGFARRAAARILTDGVQGLGLEVIGAWTVEINVPSRRALEHLNFRFIGRQRRCHWIDGKPYDRLPNDLPATGPVPDD